MSNEITAPMSAIEKLVLENDISKLSNVEKMAYYNWRCQELGLSPSSRPFEFLKLDGKIVLYPKKELAEQLRAMRKLSTKIERGYPQDGVWVVQATVTDADNRQATDIGAVPIIYPDKVKVWENGQSRWEPHPHAGKQFTGADLANAMKKATSQATRRATFSLAGLGSADVDDVEGVVRLDIDAVIKPTLPKSEAAPVVVTSEPAALPAPTEQPASDAPESWVDSAKWPSDNIDETVAIITNVATKDGTTAGKKWTKVTVSCKDDAGEFECIAWSTTAEAVARKHFGRQAALTICDVPNKGIKLLAIKPHAAASAPTPATSAPMADGDLPF